VTSYHVKVQIDNGWYVGRVLERPGITTQGRSLDELVLMVRDAIEAMWGQKRVALELILPDSAAVSAKPRRKRVA
jgi:predicted RNase H-like HicB family nuclease